MSSLPLREDHPKRGAAGAKVLRQKQSWMARISKEVSVAGAG